VEKQNVSSLLEEFHSSGRFPLNMLQCNGFRDAIVIVQDSAKTEMAKIPEKYGLSIKLEVVAISREEELGTADSLRKVSDKLTGSDLLVVSGDLILEPDQLREFIDLHRLKSAALTTFLGPSPPLKGLVVPGSKSTKHKRERDLVGLAGDQICLLSAEADVEERLQVPRKVCALHPRVTVLSGLQDCHLYIMKRWILDYITANRNISTVKGELLPALVSYQFGSSRRSEYPSIEDFLPPKNISETQSKTRYQCFAYQSPNSSVCLRVNTVPVYWFANQGIVAPLLEKAGVLSFAPKAQVGERAQLSEASFGKNTVIANKTSLTKVHLGKGCKIEEKVRIINSVIMDHVIVASGSVIEDSIISDGSHVCGKIKNCLVGRSQEVNGAHENETILASDRMMEALVALQSFDPGTFQNKSFKW